MTGDETDESLLIRSAEECYLLLATQQVGGLVERTRASGAALGTRRARALGSAHPHRITGRCKSPATCRRRSSRRLSLASLPSR